MCKVSQDSADHQAKETKCCLNIKRTDPPPLKNQIHLGKLIAGDDLLCTRPHQNTVWSFTARTDDCEVPDKLYVFLKLTCDLRNIATLEGFVEFLQRLQPLCDNVYISDSLTSVTPCVHAR